MVYFFFGLVQENSSVGVLKTFLIFLLWNQIFCHVRNMQSVKVETCMQLLHALKEELGFQVSRTSLDFLLSMCVKARDSETAMIVWKEYESAGLPYNVLTKLRFMVYLCTYFLPLLFSCLVFVLVGFFVFCFWKRLGRCYQVCSCWFKSSFAKREKINGDQKNWIQTFWLIHRSLQINIG